MAVERRPRPIAGEGEVVVAVAAAGICGSELTSFTGASGRRPPGRVFGHEVAGTVVAVGEGVTDALLGRRVAVNPLVACGQCRMCLAGRANACPDRTLLGLHLDGGFAEEVAISAAALHPLGELDEVAGSLAEPLANAVHVARLLPAVIGQRVLVLGAGPIGLCVVAMLGVAGAASITVIDPVSNRRALALAAGAHQAFAPDEAAAAQIACDHVVDAVGATESRRAAISHCPAGGCVVLVGLHTADSALPINDAIAKELRMQCSYAYTQSDFDVAMELLRRGMIPYEPWITELALDQGQAAFQALTERLSDVTKIILRPPSVGA
jgi:threonine dehydrogenase-like Zn-dependent dehydrogenase